MKLSHESNLGLYVQCSHKPDALTFLPGLEGDGQGSPVGLSVCFASLSSSGPPHSSQTVLPACEPGKLEYLPAPCPVAPRLGAARTSGGFPWLSARMALHGPAPAKGAACKAGR